LAEYLQFIAFLPLASAYQVSIIRLIIVSLQL